METRQRVANTRLTERKVHISEAPAKRLDCDSNLAIDSVDRQQYQHPYHSPLHNDPVCQTSFEKTSIALFPTRIEALQVDRIVGNTKLKAA